MLVRACGWRRIGDDRSTGVLFGAGWTVALIGWGWDLEQPWRPWPTLRTTPTPAGNRGFCLAWAGFFINLRRRPRG